MNVEGAGATARTSWADGNHYMLANYNNQTAGWSTYMVVIGGGIPSKNVLNSGFGIIVSCPEYIYIGEISCVFCQRVTGKSEQQRRVQPNFLNSIFSL